MLEDAGGRMTAGREALIRSVLGNWRDGLIDLTAANPLLDLRPGRSTAVPVTRAAGDEVLARLRAGGTFTFRSLRPWQDGPEPGGTLGPVPPPAPYLLDTSEHPDDLEAALRALMRRAQQAYLDRGLPGLYLAFGALTWAGRDGARHASPLLLVPVRLVATEPRQPPMLEPAEDDPLVNPALMLHLSRHGIRLPGVGDPAEITVSGLLDAVRAAVAGRGGWQAGDGIALAGLPFPAEVLYQDVPGQEELAAAHPVLAALAAASLRQPGRGAGAAPATVPGTGSQAAPAGVPVVLDADSAQRACIAAAVAGRSFTIDGPPGTGKSQTIANIIGALLHAGATVLFVSEKAAALEVVSRRLAGAGLGPYLLELHSRQGTRREVAAALGRALDTVPAAPAGTVEPDAAGQRDQLARYASALHRVRDPLGYSLHDVLAMLAGLQLVPAAPGTGIAPANLTPAAMADSLRAAAALAGAWRPAGQERSFPWRGVTERGPLDDRLYRAASALEALGRAVRVNQTLADATGLTRPSDAPTLAGLLDYLLTWPEGVPDEWLTADTLDAADAAVAQLSALLTAIAARESQAAQVAGGGWQTIPRPGELPAADSRALSELVPACADVSGLTAAQISGLAREFAAQADLLGTRMSTLASLAGVLGLRAPATFADANDLLTLARLAGESDRPPRAWLSVPGHQAASTAARVLYEANRTLVLAEADAATYFTPAALGHDVAGLAQRFAHDHHRLGRLSGDYRADKRTIASFTRDGVIAEAAQENIALAAAWRQAADALAAAEAGHAQLLGSYYGGRATDFDRLGRALTHAATAVRCARGQDLSQAAEHISAEAAPKPVITATLADIRRDLAAWQSALAPPPAPAPRPELLNGTIAAAIGWLRAHLVPLAAMSEFTQAAGEAVGRQFTFGQARQLLALREAADAAHAELRSRDAVFLELCGRLYAGAATDVQALRKGLEWARRLRTLVTGGTGPLSPAQLKAAESAVPTDRLASAAEAWQEARSALLAAFSADRRRELAAELDDFGRGDELLEAMFNDTGGRAEWDAHQAARATLSGHGLDAAVEFCVAGRLEAAQVPHVIQRALLQDWADYQLRTDPALAPLRGVGSDALVREYQRLDATLHATAAGDIIHACNTRRPAGDSAGVAVIRLEAAKKAKHLPVRELLDRTRELTQALKPCFLLTPAAASQHLPAGLRFDVVIIDEASQLSAAAAIPGSCRGGTLILAGDRQQLPPQPPAESVLGLAQRSGVLPSLPLRWHYRSRQPELIAFANAAFYDGRLVPLPGPDGGVELLPGRGTGQPGGGNPEEAARVAQQVIRHAETRPERSLGVVTFSEAQAAAIDTALTAARRQRPDLDQFFTADRLRGFFVKTAGAVQGDERDEVIVSLGYAPDEHGQLPAELGPLSRPDGWRWLNVAITRARYRTEVVTSIGAADIPAAVTGDGLRCLRSYLEYTAGAR